MLVLSIIILLCVLFSIVTNCDHILSVNGGEMLTKLLTATDNKIVMVSIEILWNLLEKGSRLQVNA